MPQTFQVLRCYKCEVFQVHPTKKSTKWQCKLCGEKQSIKRFYGLGTGKECRLHVQKLNGIRGEIDSSYSTTSDLSDTPESLDQSDLDKTPVCSNGHKSKWLDYVDTQEAKNHETPDETMHLNNTEVVAELPVKRRKKCLSVTNKTLRAPSYFDNNESFKTQQTNDKLESLEEEEPMCLQHYATNNVLSSLRSNLNTCISKHANKIIPKKYVPPPLANNSKWLEFVDGTEHDSNENESEPIVHRSVGSVFPFLEDENIDTILDL